MKRPARTPLRVVMALFVFGLVLLMAVLAARTIAAGRRLPIAPPAGDPIAIDGERAARRLVEAIRFQTITWQVPSMRSAEALAGFRQWLVKSYPRFHADTERTILHGGTLIYRWQGSDPRRKPIILMAHQDVVPALDPSRWSFPPFAGVEQDGVIWGRGAVDDKGPLVALFEAVETLAERGFRPRADVYLVSGHDEEGESRGAQDAAMWLKTRGVKAEFVLDEGSAIITDNPVTGGRVALIGISEKGYATLRITASAPGGHSSAPPDQSAVLLLARALEAIAGDGFELRYTGPVVSMMDELAGQMAPMQRVAVANAWLFAPLLERRIAATPAGAAMLRTTMAPTMLAASPKENVLPTTAEALINYRLAPWDDPAAILARARRAVRGMPVKIAFTRPPLPAAPVSSTTSRGYRAIAGWATKLGNAPAAPMLVIGGTDSRMLAPVADDIYRFTPIPFDLEEGEMIHGRNEHISRAHLAMMVEFYAQLIRSTAS